MRELRTLRLPQMVEARRKKESDDPTERARSMSVGYPIQLSRSSTSSDAPSPTTPTFSSRGPLHSSTSPSSLASSPNMRASFDSLGPSKRPLTEVKEEPQEREDDLDLFRTSSATSYGCDWDSGDRFAGHGSLDILGDGIGGSPSPTDYNLMDNVEDGRKSWYTQSAEKLPGDGSPMSGLSMRLGSRFPSFSRKRKERRALIPASMTDTLQETIASRSRANSTRASSFQGSILDLHGRQEVPLPPTPTKSVFEDGNIDAPISPIDIRKANAHADVEDDDAEAEGLATTPLLPPMIAQLGSPGEDEPIQSPLQSPSIADCFPNSPTPAEIANAFGLPSPPLSTRPSVSSFHHRQLGPNFEVPLEYLAENGDEWAVKLGHANFNIHPEPYLPTTCDSETSKQLRANWDIARRNYMKHLARTGEHYSSNSRIYHLTEDKWSQIDSRWKECIDECASRTAEHHPESRQSSLVPLKPSPTLEPVPLMKLPSLNGPHSEGKFPKLGDVDIVGPMIREETLILPQTTSRPSRKRAFWKFVQGVLPSSVAFGRGSSSKRA